MQLHDLSEQDLYRILTEPESHLIRQAKALLSTEDVDVRFTDEAIREIAKVSSDANKTVENIGKCLKHEQLISILPFVLFALIDVFSGARRLHTVIEKVLEDVSFSASQYKGQVLVIDREEVQKHMKEFADKADLKHLIL